jgi:hypothetical protein
VFRDKERRDTRGSGNSADSRPDGRSNFLDGVILNALDVDSIGGGVRSEGGVRGNAHSDPQGITRTC